MPGEEKLGKAVLELTTDNRKLVKGLATAKKTADKETKSIAKSASNLAKSWMTSFAAMGAGVVSVTGAIKLLQEAIENAKLAAKFNAISDAFGNAAANMGQDADRIVASIQRASGGTVSALESLTAASRAQVLGLPIAELDQLMGIARASARAMGEDVGSMFDSLTLGVARQSRMLLDNLGIIVDIQLAYQKHADVLGINVNQLTEVRRKTAFYLETLEKGQVIIQNVGGDMDELTDLERWSKLTAAVEDFKVALGQNLLPTMGRVATFGTAMLELFTLLAKSSKGMADGVIPDLTEELERLNELGFKPVILGEGGGGVFDSLNALLGTLGKGPISTTPSGETPFDLAIPALKAEPGGAKRSRGVLGPKAFEEAISSGFISAMGHMGFDRGFTDPFRQGGPQNQQAAGGGGRVITSAGPVSPAGGAEALARVFKDISMVGTDLIGMFIGNVEGLGKFQQILDPLGTIFAGMMEVLGPLVSEILSPFVNMLKIVGNTIGKILAPVFKLLADVSKSLGVAFVWLHNNVFLPIGKAMAVVFSAISSAIALFVNAIFALIQIITIGLVNFRRLPVTGINTGSLQPISVDDLTSGPDGAGGGAAGATFKQLRPIDVEVNVIEPQIYGGTLREFVLLLRTELFAIDELGL